MADKDQQLTLQERGKSSDYVLGLKEKQNEGTASRAPAGARRPIWQCPKSLNSFEVSIHKLKDESC